LSAEPGVRVPLRFDLLSYIGQQMFLDWNSAMPTGTVKWFNATKGFGFIQPDDGSKDVFLHISDVQRAGIQEPREGEKLSYELQKGQQGKVSAGNLKQG
jgi:CspA family cold shock protein